MARKLKLIDYQVWHANGKQYIVSLPKMSNAKLRDVLITDAKSDGTVLKGFKECKPQVYN